MAFAVVQTAHSNGNVGAITVPATTIGNLLLLGISYDAGSPTLALTGGGTWAGIGQQNDSGNGQDIQLFWALCTGSVTTVSLAGGSTIGATGIAYAEFSGVASTSPLDTSNALKSFATGTSFTSNSITTANVGSQTANGTLASSDSAAMQIAAFKALTGSNELIIGFLGSTGGTGAAFTHGASFTTAISEPGVGGSTGGASIEWKEVTAGGGNDSILPGTVNATSNVTAAVGGGGTTHHLSVGQINATSAVTASAGGAFPLTPSGIGATSFVSVLAPTCWATSNVTGTVSKGAGATPLTIGAVIATSGVTATEQKGGNKPLSIATINGTSFVTYGGSIVGKVLFSADQASQIMHIINL